MLPFKDSLAQSLFSLLLMAEEKKYVRNEKRILFALSDTKYRPVSTEKTKIPLNREPFHRNVFELPNFVMSSFFTSKLCTLQSSSQQIPSSYNT